PPDPRMLPPEIEKVLADRLGEFLSRLIDHYLPAGGLRMPATPPEPANDPHRVLGLRRGCTEADIRRRVRELARIFHPDMTSGDGTKMAEINRAADLILAELRQGRP